MNSRKIMNCISILMIDILLTIPATAQKIVRKINKTIQHEMVYQDMMYLASDALKGRKPGEPGNTLAAEYIANEFKKAGLIPVPGMKDYFQVVPMHSRDGSRNFDAMNVIGMIPGRKIMDQYILLTAHLDHIGVNHNVKDANDSIWNGARDNAWGVTSLLVAARMLNKCIPDRSILIAAVNGEEMGLVGSRFLAANPVLPWNQVKFDLNTDGAGYNDTTIVSILGLHRVGAEDEITHACKTFGLQTYADPAPEQGLFDRSDNVSFAMLGIPSPTFSSGFKSFDSEIYKYYHQVSDNPESINFNYLLRFCKAFTLAAYNVANKKELPKWSEGDKYEKAAKKLYNY